MYNRPVVYTNIRMIDFKPSKYRNLRENLEWGKSSPTMTNILFPISCIIT